MFMLLVMEDDVCWDKHWSTYNFYFHEILFVPVPGVRLPLLDIITLGLLVAAYNAPGSSKGRVKQVETAIWVSIGSVLLWALIGIARGGSAFQIRLQLHVFVMVQLTALMLVRAFTQPKHFAMLGRTIVYAGIYRFVFMFIFYLSVMRSLPEKLETVTEHQDSLLFATTIAIVLAHAFHTKSRGAVWRAVVVTGMMLWCIQVNNRRLAWTGLAGALISMYFLFNIGPLRKKINRFLFRLAPIVLVYAAVGWSHPTGVFKPLASLQSVGDKNNPSTASRILENIGLVVTMQTNPLIGTGFGHEYIEISTTYSVGAKIFPEYRYDPHNSVLGLAAFTGALGFSGLWMVFAVGAFLNARAYAFADTPLARTITMSSICAIFIHINQMWGDLGVLAPQGVAFASAAIAAGSRMAVSTGAWPEGKRGVAKSPAQVPQPQRGVAAS
jgi:hypothetical protein